MRVERQHTWGALPIYRGYCFVAKYGYCKRAARVVRSAIGKDNGRKSLLNLAEIDY